jgi:hypothetical protein
MSSIIAPGPHGEPWRQRALIALIVLCWAVGALPQIAKYLSGTALIAATLAGAIVVLATVKLVLRSPSEPRPVRPLAWLCGFWLAMLLLYLVLYPLSQRHTVGIGSDAEDALRVAALQLTRLSYPYSAHTYIGNPITPLPGAILLALPFEPLGRVGLQNIFWLTVLIVLCTEWLGDWLKALGFLMVMSLEDLVSVDQFVTGGDYTVNTWYVCAAVMLFLGAHASARSVALRLGTAVLLGVTLSSRLVYPIVIVPLLAAYLARRRGPRAATLCLLTPLIVAIGITVPFYLYDPAQFAPLHVQQKLLFLPRAEAQAVLIGLPLAAALVACSGFLVHLTLARIFLIAGVASSTILLLPSVLMLLQTPVSQFNWQLLSYANASATFVALWAFQALSPLKPRAREFRLLQRLCLAPVPASTQSMPP